MKLPLRHPMRWFNPWPDRERFAWEETSDKALDYLWTYVVAKLLLVFLFAAVMGAFDLLGLPA